jgi:predicted DNA-binding protein with PD1-like motif
MTSTFDGFNYTVRLDKGERLREALEQFFATYPQLDGASVAAVGGAQEMTLGFYDLEAQEYQWHTFMELYEITSLQGTIALDESGKLMYHLHGTFAGRNYQVVGGHVKDLIVGGTCELFVHRTYQPLRRKHDETTGLQLLDLHDERA